MHITSFHRAACRPRACALPILRHVFFLSKMERECGSTRLNLCFWARAWFSLICSLTRWDSIHFLHIAASGYDFEQVVDTFCMIDHRLTIKVLCLWTTLSHVDSCAREHIEPGSFSASRICDGRSSDKQYLLCLRSSRIVQSRLQSWPNLQHLSNKMAHESVGMAAALLFCINPASIFMSAVYSESLFALCTFRGLGLLDRCAISHGTHHPGMLLGMHVSTLHWPRRRGATACSTAVRPSIQFLLTVHLAFFHFRQPTALRLLLCLVQCCVAVAPFAALQLHAYLSLCVNTGTPRPFCGDALPLASSFVQRHYWDVGPFRYWTLAQVP
jgi:Gpi18-like mannosyltransferase